MYSIDRFFQQTRREFLGRCGLGLASMAFTSLLKGETSVGEQLRTYGRTLNLVPMSPKPPHFAPRARNVIFLFMVGGPSQLDLFDYKPVLNQREGEPVPESLIRGAKFAQITEKQPKLMGSKWKFARHG